MAELHQPQFETETEDYQMVLLNKRDTKRERFRLHNELACLARALQGYCTTVDLRNDNYVTGTISNVDGFMNIEMENAVLTNRRGNHTFCDSFFILARSIRYIHIPEGESILDLIKRQLDSMKRKPREQKKPKTFKIKRALLNHMETVASLGESSQNPNNSDNS